MGEMPSNAVSERPACGDISRNRAVGTHAEFRRPQMGTCSHNSGLTRCSVIILKKRLRRSLLEM